ncbi:MAG: hypothetical protein R3D29_06650 [Nitratireductor sp.]
MYNTVTGGDATGDTVSVSRMSPAPATVDYIYGDANANAISGNGGADWLYGGGGGDTVANGGAGADLMFGEASGDIMNGGGRWRLRVGWHRRRHHAWRRWLDWLRGERR